MAPERFFHVAIKTDDLEASTAFYRDALGGRIVGRSDETDDYDYVALSVADKRIYLFDRPPYEAKGLVEELPTGILHFGFVVPDVGAATEALESAGADVLMAPERFGDIEIAFVYGPSGERVELIEEL